MATVSQVRVPQGTLLNVRTPGANVPYALKYAWLAGASVGMDAGSIMVNCTGELLRTRIHSVLLKKNSLFLTMGPPSEKP